MSSSILMAGDLDEPTMLWRNNSDEIVAEGDQVTLICGAIKYTFSGRIEWKFNGEFIENFKDDEIEIKPNNTEFSYRSMLIIKDVNQLNTGEYSCVIAPYNKTKMAETERYYLQVYKRKPARIVDSNINDRLMSLGDPLEMFCQVEGIPPPEVKWLKDGQQLTHDALNIAISKEGNRSFARIMAVKIEHEGVYECFTWNKDGDNAVNAKLEIQSRCTL